MGCLASRSLGIVKTTSYHFPNHPIFTHSLGNLILQTLNCSQHILTGVFSIQRTSTWISHWMYHIPFHEAVGSLLYLTITHALILLQFMDNPGQVHQEGVKHIFWYLAGTVDCILIHGTRVKVWRDLLVQMVLCRSIDMQLLDMHFWSMGAQFPRVTRNKKSSQSPLLSHNLLLPHTAKEALYYWWSVPTTYKSNPSLFRCTSCHGAHPLQVLLHSNKTYHHSLSFY